MTTNLILGLAAILFAIDRIQSYLAKNSKSAREEQKYSAETVAILEKNIAAKDGEIQKLIADHNIERVEWEKEKALMQKDIEALKVQNDGLVDKAFNKELLLKMQTSIDRLTEVKQNSNKLLERLETNTGKTDENLKKINEVLGLFVPLVREGGLLDNFKQADTDLLAAVKGVQLTLDKK